MIVKGTRQLGSFKKGINLYIPNKKPLLPQLPPRIPAFIPSPNSIFNFGFNSYPNVVSDGPNLVTFTQTSTSLTTTNAPYNSSGFSYIGNLSAFSSPLNFSMYNTFKLKIASVSGTHASWIYIDLLNENFEDVGNVRPLILDSVQITTSPSIQDLTLNTDPSYFYNIHYLAVTFSTNVGNVILYDLFGYN